MEEFPLIYSVSSATREPQKEGSDRGGDDAVDVFSHASWQKHLVLCAVENLWCVTYGMDGPPRRPPVLRQRSDSQGRALSPADSVTSLGGTRAPLLSVMFHHIRRDNQDSLTKEDLRRLLDVDMDNEQLDEAFENLDVDGDGRVSQDEFLGGFARFLLEAPTTPGKDRNSLLLGIGQEQGGQRGRGGGRKRGSVRRRLVDEECYESTAGTHAMNGAERPSENGEPAVKPSETFAGSLSTLSSHNK